jgi:hypothetical protein
VLYLERHVRVVWGGGEKNSTLPACIAPRFGLIHMPSTALSIVFLSLVLGAVECLCGRRGIIRLLGALFTDKYQATRGNHQFVRQP